MSMCRKTCYMKKTKAVYIDNEHVAKHIIWLAKFEAEKVEFATKFPDFHITKQMNLTNQDVFGENCVRNDAGDWRRQGEGVGWGLH